MQIDTTGIEPGEYDLILESYNTLSIAKSALKTDTMTIFVKESEPPTFAEEITLTPVEAGSGTTWSLP